MLLVAQYNQGSMRVLASTPERVEMIAAREYPVPEPCIGCVGFAGGSWDDEEAPSVVRIVLGGCTPEAEVSSIHVLLFVWAFDHIQGNTWPQTVTLLRWYIPVRRRHNGMYKIYMFLFIDGTMKCIREVSGIDNDVHTTDFHASRLLFVFPGHDPALFLCFFQARLQMMGYLSSHRSVPGRTMIAGAMQSNATYAGPRFEVMVSHECVTVSHMRQQSIERPHGWPAMICWFDSFRLDFFVLACLLIVAVLHVVVLCGVFCF